MRRGLFTFGNQPPRIVELQDDTYDAITEVMDCPEALCETLPNGGYPAVDFAYCTPQHEGYAAPPNRVASEKIGRTVYGPVVFTSLIEVMGEIPDWWNDQLRDGPRWSLSDQR